MPSGSTLRAPFSQTSHQPVEYMFNVQTYAHSAYNPLDRVDSTRRPRPPPYCPALPRISRGHRRGNPSAVTRVHDSERIEYCRGMRRFADTHQAIGGR